MKIKKRVLLLGVLGFSLLNTNMLSADTQGNWKKLDSGKWIFLQNNKTVKSNWIDYKGNWYYLLSNGEMKENGWEKIKGSWYYFEDGKMLSSQFIDYKGSKYYLGKDGNMLTNTIVGDYSIDSEGIARKREKNIWKQKDNKWFYYGENGTLYKSKWKEYKGNWYYLLSNGEMKENGWEKIKGSWYYFEDGKMLSSQFIDYKGSKYYLGKDGNILTNTIVGDYSIDSEGIARKREKNIWKQKDNKWFYYGEDGTLYKSKWKKHKGNWYYLLSNGEMKENGWEKIKGSWYYFEDGKMLSGDWKYYKGAWYYLVPSGEMRENAWEKVKNSWYYFDEDGKMLSADWKYYKGTWYYLVPSGEMRENAWEKVKNSWYYFDEDGKMLSGVWKYYKETWYYLLSNGEMKENGWEKIKDSWYYFIDGKMLSNQFVDYKGSKYYLGKYGDMLINTRVENYVIGSDGVAKRVNSKPITSNSEFINKITPGVLKAVKGKGLFPSIAVAQACLETGFGNDGLSPAPIYNLFGIKAADNTPPERYYEIRTAEYDKNGNKYYITDKFMKFSGYDEAFEYYAGLFTRTPWLTRYYRNVVSAKTPEEAAKALTGTYATDPGYGSKLLNIIDTYNLRELDKEIFSNGVKP